MTHPKTVVFDSSPFRFDWNPEAGSIFALYRKRRRRQRCLPALTLRILTEMLIETRS
jgi:hypothetical protein